ncbi:MAG: hypothetical protein M1818_003932 [Claussenomyces sp. TS43310]|nr:MAG: hypothetical protein M1818_003932 [Claussenomyces sp. TS43310]
MVTRKPVPRNASMEARNDLDLLQSRSTNQPQPLQERNALQHALSDGSLQDGREDLPDSLRAGTADDTPGKSAETQRPLAEITNPYMRKQSMGSELYDGGESSANSWAGIIDRPPPPANPPPPPPVPKDEPPIDQFSRLSVDQSNAAQSQSGRNANPPPQIPRLPPIEPQDYGNGAEPSHPPSVLINMPSETGSPGWDEEDEDPFSRDSFVNVQTPHAAEDGGNAWKDDERHEKQEAVSMVAERAAQEEYLKRPEGWATRDSEDSAQQSGIIGKDGIEVPSLPAAATQVTEEQAPPLLPPRSMDENPPPQPPRPHINIGHQSSNPLATPGTPGSLGRQQKRETYEIKRMAWHDVNAQKNPRTSPILVQNVNGPCPLLALVNALTLSTPAELDTPLVESLRSREQISLGLLLDAVIDELMSGRRGNSDMELPNLLDLHHFLLDLHTGMNVNPRYFPKTPTNLLDDSPVSFADSYPADRDEGLTPGKFEETREISLYGIFSIPLIHGWLPSKGSPAFRALYRSARSYEEVQNLQFREEELEDKLATEGLSFEEQATLEDIATIKAFLQESATQLTPYGLNTILKSMPPGSFAILFRNNHFSTLYRHPINHQLLQLVTDMGYVSHEEVVWESLADVNGENCELFSGDFRLVGGAPSSPRQNEALGWTTVSRRGDQSRTNINRGSLNQHRNDADLSNHYSHDNSGSLGSHIASPNTEQEDHDLALALQLQEEEEERERAEAARRRRETELSQQYIEQQGVTNANARNIPVTTRSSGNTRRSRVSTGGFAEARPSIPPRRNNTNTTALPVDPEAGVDLPPPSYEQAATQRAYNPPVNHPAHAGSSPNSTRRSSAHSASSPTSGSTSNPRVNAIGGIAGPRIADAPQARRRASQPTQTGQDKDCVVM